jgi:hypothetical protein
MTSEKATVGTVGAYTSPEAIGHSAGKRRMLVEDKAKMFGDGSCLKWGRYNHRAAECATQKKAQIFRVGGVDINEVETKEGSEIS